MQKADEQATANSDVEGASCAEHVNKVYDSGAPTQRGARVSLVPANAASALSV